MLQLKIGHRIKHKVTDQAGFDVCGYRYWMEPWHHGDSGKGARAQRIGLFRKFAFDLTLNS